LAVTGNETRRSKGRLGIMDVMVPETTLVDRRTTRGLHRESVELTTLHQLFLVIAVAGVRLSRERSTLSPDSRLGAVNFSPKGWKIAHRSSLRRIIRRRIVFTIDAICGGFLTAAQRVRGETHKGGRNERERESDGQ
jgi:hypothetical protein